MDKTPKLKPKVTHNPKSKTEVGKFKRVVTEFVTREMVPAFEDQIGKKSGWDRADDEMLLHLRRKLVHKIKEGMLERKDLEVDIANYAVMVWYARLTKERRELIDSWGT